MLKNNIFKAMEISLLAMSLIGSSVFADTTDFGARDASNDTTYTLEELNTSRPFTNIIKTEKTHIKIVKTLFKAYNLPLQR
jgi:hypothetical protein